MVIPEKINSNQELTEDTLSDEKRGEMLLQAVVSQKVIKNRLRVIIDYINKYNISIETAISEVHNKESKLSKSTRDFLIEFKPDFINSLIETYKNATTISRR